MCVCVCVQLTCANGRAFMWDCAESKKKKKKSMPVVLSLDLGFHLHLFQNASDGFEVFGQCRGVEKNKKITRTTSSFPDCFLNEKFALTSSWERH